MAKKRVPDWLNSPMWSTPADHHRFSATPEPPPEPPSPPPASFPIREDPPTIQHARINHNGVGTSRASSDSDSSSASSSAADDGSHSSRQAQLLAELSRKVIDMRELRRIASQGIPDICGLRSTVWKLFLGYLPPDRALWSSELAKKRSQYKRFKEDVLVNPSEITRRMCNSTNHDDGNTKSKCETRVMLPRSQITHEEHPLSLGKTSIWNQFFQDTEIIEQIDRDVKRTHPDMHFFCGDSQIAKSNQEALKNILIIFAKLNPGIRYVQGMNEILAPLFYVFKNDPDQENAAFAEADTFFCFVELLSGLRDFFCQQLDNSVIGIRSIITRLSQLLKEHDQELWRHLEVTTKVRRNFEYLERKRDPEITQTGLAIYPTVFSMKF